MFISNSYEYQVETQPVVSHILKSNGIHTLFHFTKIDNGFSIFRNGLLSNRSLKEQSIIPKMSHGSKSNELDVKKGIDNYIFLSLFPVPAMYDRIVNFHNYAIYAIDISVLDSTLSYYSKSVANSSQSVITPTSHIVNDIDFWNYIRGLNFFWSNQSSLEKLKKLEFMIMGEVRQMYIRNYSIYIPSDYQITINDIELL